MALAVLCLLTSPVIAGEKAPKSGGTLKIAWVGEPPTLDIHKSGTTSTRRLAWHVFERLFTFDEQYNLIPEVAEGYDVSPDGKTYTVRIRKGVLSHNGQELTTDENLLWRQALLPAGLLDPHERNRLVEPGRLRAVQPEKCPEGQTTIAGGGLRRHAAALAHHPGLPVYVQDERRRETAIGGGWV
jgi:hypothetical protein